MFVAFLGKYSTCLLSKDLAATALRDDEARDVAVGKAGRNKEIRLAMSIRINS